MDRIKGILIGILIMFLIIIIPVGVVNDFFNFIADAIKWTVFIDNAETGLPMYAEMLIKGIVEGLIVLILGYIGLKEKNPITIIISVILAFVTCVIIYWLAKYIFVILCILLGLIIMYVCYLIINNNKEKSKGDTQND